MLSPGFARLLRQEILGILPPALYGVFKVGILFAFFF